MLANTGMTACDGRQSYARREVAVIPAHAGISNAGKANTHRALASAEARGQAGDPGLRRDDRLWWAARNARREWASAGARRQVEVIPAHAGISNAGKANTHRALASAEARGQAGDPGLRRDDRLWWAARNARREWASAGARRQVEVIPAHAGISNAGKANTHRALASVEARGQAGDPGLRRDDGLWWDDGL